MKKLLFTSFLLCSLAFTLQAQKFAYVDTEYILKHVPEYAEAIAELNEHSSDWQGEIEAKYESIVLLEQAFAAEKILLTPDMRQKREEEIMSLKQIAMQMQKQKFGVDGELFSKREELIKPIQDQIYEAIKEVASSRGYMVIFDKANQNNMLYSNPKYDVSDQVIKKMGLKPGETIEIPGGKDEKGTNSDKGTTGVSKTKGQTPNQTGTKTGGRTVPAGGKK